MLSMIEGKAVQAINKSLEYEDEYLNVWHRYYYNKCPDSGKDLKKEMI